MHLIHNTHVKLQLYYSKYKYSISFGLPECWYLRKSKTFLESEKLLAAAYKDKMAKGLVKAAEQLNASGKLLLKFSEWKENHPENRYSFTHMMTVYSNDMSVVDFAKDNGIYSITVNEIERVVEEGTMLRKNPKYTYRLYCKPIHITTNILEQFHSIITEYGDKINVSPSIVYAAKNWVKHRRFRKQYYSTRNIFIDYNDEGLDIVLRLTLDAMFKEALEIKKLV